MVIDDNMSGFIKKCENCGSINDFLANTCVKCGKLIDNVTDFKYVEDNMDISEFTDSKPQKSKTEAHKRNSYIKNESDAECLKEIEKIRKTRFIYRPDEFAYARCERLVEGGAVFVCIDGFSSFYQPSTIVKDIQPHDFIWVKLGNVKQWQGGYYRYEKAFRQAPNSKSVGLEANTLYKYLKKGDIISAPVEKTYNMLKVYLASKFYSPIMKNDIPAKLFEKLENNIYQFKVLSVEKIGKVVRIKLEFFNPQREESPAEKISEEKVDVTEQDVPAPTEKPNPEPAWVSELPISFDSKSIQIPSSILYNIRYEKSDVQFFDELIPLFDSGYDDARVELFSKLAPLYKKAYDKGLISYYYNKDYHFASFPTGVKDVNGAPLHIGLKKNKKTVNDSKWIVNLVGVPRVEEEFNKYVYVRDWEQMLKDLDEMALKGEQWDLPGEKQRGKRFILQQYIKYTFYKVMLDRLYRENERFFVFNTGLVDTYYNDIYCILEHNHTKSRFYPRYRFHCFAVWGQGNGKSLVTNFGDNRANRLAPPKYFDKLEDVFYDGSIEPICDYAHIIRENLSRLPIEFLGKIFYGAEFKQINESLNKYLKAQTANNFKAVEKSILENESALRLLKQRLEGAVQNSVKYCRWNYKAAVPMYYPRKNGISMLLPLFLTNSEKADVALVIQKVHSEAYQGETILTLAMAYQDARVIGRPSSDWLNTNSIKEDNTDEIDFV